MLCRHGVPVCRSLPWCLDHDSLLLYSDFRELMTDTVTVWPGPCLDSLKKLEFFHSLSITSIFARMHEALNVDKKLTNCPV
jgi:hypothetical protein